MILTTCLLLLAGGYAAICGGLRAVQVRRTHAERIAANTAIRAVLDDFEPKMKRLRAQARTARAATATLRERSRIHENSASEEVAPEKHPVRAATYIEACRPTDITDACRDQLWSVVVHAERASRALYQLNDYFHDVRLILRNTPSLAPTHQGWLTSGFGKRHDPFSKRPVWHKGLDFGGYVGMPVFAPADGKVIWAGNRGGYGRTVVIDHGHGIQTHYAHLSAYAVKRGSSVRRGQKIAEVGSSGRSTGPHLHYEVRHHGEPRDPINYILD